MYERALDDDISSLFFLFNIINKVLEMYIFYCFIL